MSPEELDFELVNQIDYLVGFINKTANNAHQQEVIEILTTGESLLEMRRNLVEIVSVNKLIKKKKKPTNDGAKIEQNKNMLKPNAVQIPCLGSGMVARTNKSVSECIFLNYEDYNKLVYFTNRGVSSFVEDLVQYITIGLVSVQSVETYLGHLRGPQYERQTFSACYVSFYQCVRRLPR